MKEEISAAVTFLSNLVGKNEGISIEQVEIFQQSLQTVLTERFQDHWFPEKPFKGQAYRCIRVNETERRDPVLERAAEMCGLQYENLNLPVELTIWVDPQEVCCRFGEHEGSYCTVASFKNDNKENCPDKLKIPDFHKMFPKLNQEISACSKKLKSHRKKHSLSRIAYPQQNVFRGIHSRSHLLNSTLCPPSCLEWGPPRAMASSQDAFLSRRPRKQVRCFSSHDRYHWQRT